MRRTAVALALSSSLSALSSLAVVACDKEPSKLDRLVEAGASGPAEAAAPAAIPARPPQIVIDTGYVNVGSDRVGTSEADLGAKVTMFLTGKPMVEGEVLEFVALRQVKPPLVATVAAALRKAKAKAVIVRTQNRDGNTVPLELVAPATLKDCVPVAYIGKDAAINVWTVGGGVAKKYTKGLAGPDITLGSEAVQKTAGTCDVPTIVIGADELMTWGVLFDLALASKGDKTVQFVLDNGAVPGRKVAPQQ